MKAQIPEISPCKLRNSWRSHFKDYRAPVRLTLKAKRKVYGMLTFTPAKLKRVRKQ